MLKGWFLFFFFFFFVVVFFFLFFFFSYVPVTIIGVMPNKISVNIIIGKYLTEFAQTKCRYHRIKRCGPRIGFPAITKKDSNMRLEL